MDKEQFDKIKLDVSKHFPKPQQLLAAADLTQEQKLELLKQWSYDLERLMVATQENLTGDAPQGETAENLRQVQAAIAALEDPQAARSTS